MARIPITFGAGLVAGGVVVASLVGCSVFGASTQPQQPVAPAQQPAHVPAVLNPQDIQTNSSTAPVIKSWPKIRVQWQQVAQPPGATLFAKIDDGFYTGTTQNAVGWNPRPEDNVFGGKILPQSDGEMTNFIVGAVRALADKNIVFVTIAAIDSSGTREARLQGKPITEEMVKRNAYLFLSVNGEKSWYGVNLPPQIDLRVGASAVRVSVEGSTIHLIARDNTIAEVWYGTTIKRSELPVS